MKKLGRKILQQYKDMPAPVKASLWFTICNVVNKGIALLTTPIMTRILSKEQYGTYAVYQSWISILVIFASLNLYQSAFTKGLIKYDKDRRGLESSLLSLSSFITIIYFVIFLLNPSFWGGLFNLSPILVGSMFVEVFFMTAYEFWMAEQRFDYKYKLLVFLSLLMSIGSIVLGIITILNTEYKVEARVFSDVFIKSTIGLILFIWIFIRGRRVFKKEYWKYGLLFNIPLIPHFLSHFVLNQSDRIMISNMVGNSEAAVYSVAYSISMMMLLITNAINQSFTPYSYKKINAKEEQVIGKSANNIFFLVCFLCMLTMAFGPEVIMIFAGKQYYEAIWIIPPVATSVFFIFVYSMFSNIEYYYKKTTGISIASVVCAGLNLVLNYIFIKWFGYFAAGYTTLVSYIALALLHYIFYRKIMRERYGNNVEIYDLKVILLCSVAIIFIMFAMLISYNFVLLRVVLIGSGFIIGWVNRNKIIGRLRKTEN